MGVDYKYEFAKRDYKEILEFDFNKSMGRERIPSARLLIGPDTYEVQWYFEGPDRRYNGTWFSIYGCELNEYIDAWKTNFNKYMDLRQSNQIPNGGSFTIGGEKQMDIVVGGYFEGVRLRDGYARKFCIESKEKLDALIKGLEYAKNRSKIIQQNIYGINIKTSPVSKTIKEDANSSINDIEMIKEQTRDYLTTIEDLTDQLETKTIEYLLLEETNKQLLEQVNALKNELTGLKAENTALYEHILELKKV